MITRKQRELLVCVANYISANGIAPSYDEIGSSLGLKSKSGVTRLVTCLVARGMLAHLPGHARTLALTDRGKEWVAQGRAVPVLTDEERDALSYAVAFLDDHNEEIRALKVQAVINRLAAA